MIAVTRRPAASRANGSVPAAKNWKNNLRGTSIAHATDTKPMTNTPTKSRSTRFTVKYFIRKFKRIPDDRWCTVEYRVGRRRCALGHCGEDLAWTPESAALRAILGDVSGINDGVRVPRLAKYDTPKKRILAALKLKLP